MMICRGIIVSQRLLGVLLEFKTRVLSTSWLGFDLHDRFKANWEYVFTRVSLTAPKALEVCWTSWS